MGWLGSGSGAA